MPQRRINFSRIIPEIADEALRLAGGDRKEAFSLYVKLIYKLAGGIVPGCGDRELQAYYDIRGEEDA